MAAKRQFKINRDRHMIVTPIVRLSFPQLFTPRAYQDDPENKKVYRADLIFTREQLKEPYAGKKAQTVSLLTAIQNAKIDMWGYDKTKKNNGWPKFPHPTIKDGNEKTNQEGEVIEAYQDMFYITPKTGEKFPPKIYGPRKETNLTEQDLYGGCWVRAQILVKAYENGANKGIALYLNEVMKVRDDEKFGGMPTIDMDAEDDTVDEELADIETDDFAHVDF